MCIDHEWTPFSALRAIFSSAKKPKSKSQDGKVFKRITGRLCQTIQNKEITFTNPTLWCQPHKMSFSSAIIEHWADYCAGVISSALSLLTFKVSRLRVPSPFFYFCPCSYVACWPTPSPRRQSEHLKNSSWLFSFTRLIPQPPLVKHRCVDLSHGGHIDTILWRRASVINKPDYNSVVLSSI